MRSSLWKFWPQNHRNDTLVVGWQVWVWRFFFIKLRTTQRSDPCMTKACLVRTLLSWRGSATIKPVYRGSRKPFPIKRKGDVLTRAFFNVIFTNRYAIMEAKPHKSKCTDTLLLYAKFWARNSPTWHYTSMFPKPLFLFTTCAVNAHAARKIPARKWRCFPKGILTNISVENIPKIWWSNHFGLQHRV